ncbi:hypothetical protein B566_EDAN016234 [Ephemera danica]|nr:hypothetical protein B566_EDAN016234 [Ephemera danica]
MNEKCHLQLKVERNLDSLTCHPVADISSHGTLSTLHAVLSVEEYKLIRGFLAQNLGENLDDIEDLLPVQSGPTKVDSQYQLDLVWVLNCLKLDLHNVAVDLKDAEKEPLACINFIKCRLVIESRSDGSRDIDLVSKEILISDTRFINQPVNKRTNVFTNILQPVDITKRSSQVQAEIHHRRRIDGAQFTILLNNMRLMLILDWWELVREFIWTEPENCEVPPTTKPMTIVEPDETPYELKLNVTDSEIVIVEDTSQSDTNAVILKSTTVVTYRPNLKERPLSCNLNRCELFYCILGLEEDTALSIVDPVTVNMEILQREDNTMGLEVSLQHMSLRLSYHDFRMFSKMLVSLPKQTKGARKQSVSDKSKEKPVNVINQINKLQGLGFSAENCAVALDKCKGKLDDAALWLTQHAPHMEPASPQHTEEPSGSSCFNIEGIEVKADIVSVCLIDDCRDSDVPFLEFSLVKLCLCQELNPHDPARYFDKGSMRSLMTTDYYNRHLSGWEPLIEPWKCDFAWENPRTTPVFQLSISSKELLCINITNSLLQLFQTVKESWTEDYLAITRSRADSQGFRRRSPFVPFEIHNDTGSDLWFTTNVKLADHFNSVSQDPANSEVWKFVAKGETQPFSFQTQRLKLRHRHTHEMKLHQVKVRIEGWQTISPVSIDKVGCYFRFAQPDLANKDGNVPSARVVFQVTTEGTAKKLITVRSALLITNQLTCPINLSMDNRGFNHNAFEDYVILPNKTYSVPLPLVHSTLRVIPMTENQSYQSSSNALQWYHVTEPGMVKEDLYCCRPSNAHSGEYGFRFTLAVRREMYPSEAKQYHNWQEHRQLTYMYPQPAHSLTILSPIVVDNLLSSELECSVGLQTLRISPGKVASINLIDISQSISLRFLIENFTSPGQLELQPYGGSTKLSNVLLTDQQGRALQLLAKVTVKPGKGISIAVSAPYWLLNRTGLPLVFKQEGASTDAAGQGSEHEMARMVTPLLFSLSDPDHGAGLVMRLGAGVHKGGRPEWCAPLLPRRDVQLRPLRVCTSDARSDHVYQIGISSKAGKGRYHRTTMIHFVPHFLLHNKSSFELQFAQSCLATTVADPGAQATFLRAVPGCCLPFHWPKLDRDQRLCVLLLDVVDCMWSGAFSINRSDLFHLNIRDRNGGMNFILVEVSQKDASFMVTFSDAATLPPPVRVDNFAEVPIAFHQVGIRGQQSTVRPHCSIPYAWDEPGQAKRIAFTAPGGNEAVFDFSILKGMRKWHGNEQHFGRALLNDLLHQNHRILKQEDLTYENFIYLALTWTFPPPGSCPAEELRGQQLVLAVPEGENRVVLQRKEAGCRAQLWRMTANGQLGHEGTSPPRDPRREPAPQNALVLDISGVAPQPSQYVPLVVRKPDPRRQSTQTWRFTEEGRLCCVHNNMCVQAKDGFFGLRKGSEVVLGPPQPTCHQRTESGVPVEQAVSRQRLRPGSGILRLRHIADGPTRVLEITDKTAKVRITLEAGIGASLVDTVAREELAFCLLRGFSSRFAVDRAGVQKLVVTILDVQPLKLEHTLLSHNKELAFCLLRGFSSRFAVDRAGVQKLVITILDVQVDNQMFEAQCPVVVYVPKMDREIAAFDPVIDIVAVRSTSGHHNIDTVQELVVVIRSMNITIEEEQLLRVVSVLGLGAPEAEPDSTATAARAEEYDTPHIGHASASTEGVSRYFVTELCIKPEQIRLGAVPCSKLPPGLNQLRRRLGLTLIKFEDAAVDNQMFEAQCPVVVYVPKMDREIAAFDPVIDIVAVRSTSGHHNIDTVQELVVVIRSMNITIEEEQLLRVVSVLGLGAPEAEPDSTATAARAEEYDTPHIGHASASTEGVSRYFVTELCIKPEQIRLGAVPCSKLPPGLNQLRRRLGLTLIKFEDAAVDLQPLKLEHTLLSHNTLLEFISRHFQQALRTQLPVIIFSADLLGGPAGLLTNVSDGVIDVLNDPGVRSSLSDGISRVALDESHNERRLQIRRRPAGSSSGFEHIKFGIESFALGVFGGATSIFTQTYESVSVDGPPGLITGIGKGLVGTVMRPVTGALDLASAVAIREEVLPADSDFHDVCFMAYETLRSVSEDLRVIVSSEAVRVFTCNQNGVTEVIKVHLGELINCRYVMDVAQNIHSLPHHYIELTEKVLNQTSGSLSDGISRVALDESHNERRLQIRRRPAGSSSGFEHIKFGIESFALGVFGGATSIFTQTYESVSVDGPPGLITGIGKGLVGTVMRPVTGALDLASAVAIREEVLPADSDFHDVCFMAYETLRSVSEDLRVIVSSEAVRVFTCNQNGVTEVIKVHLGELINCRYVMDVAQNIHSLPHHYIELTEKVLNQTSGEMQTRRPQVCQQINYAKGMYEERIRTLVSQPGVDD